VALGDATVKLLVFFLVFSILFPVIGYALTFDSSSISTGGLDPDALMSAGIIITDAVTHNVTRAAGWTTFALNSSSYRVQWEGDEFTFQIPHPWLGWSWPTTIAPNPYLGVWAIGNFSDDYNWTNFQLDPSGGASAECFFTIYPGWTTMLDSMADGNVTVTIGKSFTPQAADLWSFGGWFLGLILGTQTFGLPAFFVWMIRVLTVIGILCAVLLAREFIPGLP
jgi:hypothetical protein